MASSLLRGWPHDTAPTERLHSATIALAIRIELASLQDTLDTSHSIRRRKAAIRRMAVLRAALCALRP